MKIDEIKKLRVKVLHIASQEMRYTKNKEG